jgi:hypothetical protein
MSGLTNLRQAQSHLDATKSHEDATNLVELRPEEKDGRCGLNVFGSVGGEVQLPERERC